MKYCKICIIPDTRPDQIFNKDGICNACLSYKKNQTIDWNKRLDEINKIIYEAKEKNSLWDCVIPSSGGKDSTYQALWAKEKGFNPILVTATTCDLSEVGKENIRNLRNLGFDVVEISNNLQTRSKLNRIGLELIGDISWPEHVSIFTAPIRFALNYKIPVILYGENPQVEYGGPEISLNNKTLDRKWMEEFGGLLGLRVSDLIENHGLKKEELSIYRYPTEEELQSFSIKSVFLGYYEKWDSIRNYLVSKKNGFKEHTKIVEGCYFKFEKIDNYQHGIHDYFKFLKYGFGRASDQLSYLIRRGKISRKQAILEVKNLEGRFPVSYLGKPLEKIIENLNLSLKQFEIICDKFTNKKIFKCDQSGKLVKDKHGNLQKNNYDNK